MDIIKKVYDFYINFKGEKGIIGYTERGREIPYIKVKKTNYPILLVHYGIHAREHITSHLSLLQIKDFIAKGKVGTVYFIPMFNIDGVDTPSFSMKIEKREFINPNPNIIPKAKIIAKSKYIGLNLLNIFSFSLGISALETKNSKTVDTTYERKEEITL